MQVHAIKYNLNRQSLGVTKKNEYYNEVEVSKYSESYPIAYNYNQINFSSHYARKTQIRALKQLENLPCIYCAKKFVSDTDFDSLAPNLNLMPRTIKEFLTVVAPFSGKLTNNEAKIVDKLLDFAKGSPNVSAADKINSMGFKMSQRFTAIAYESELPGAYTNRAVAVINKYEDALPPVEKEVFSIVKNYLQKNPGKSFQEIMKALRSEHLNKLEDKQLQVLDDMGGIAKSFSEDSKQKIISLLQDTVETIVEEDPTNLFKRKDLLGTLRALELSDNEKNLMLETARKLPTAENDVDAFIVKYSGASKTAGKSAQRSDSEIAQRFLSRLRYSVEHLETQSFHHHEINDTTGMNDISNLALAHIFCNGDRGSTELEEHIKAHPEIIQNSQIQMDFIIDAINDGSLKNCDDYPGMIKQKMFDKSKGLINLDISRLKLPARAPELEPVIVY